MVSAVLVPLTNEHSTLVCCQKQEGVLFPENVEEMGKLSVELTVSPSHVLPLDLVHFSHILKSSWVVRAAQRGCSLLTSNEIDPWAFVKTQSKVHLGGTVLEKGLKPNIYLFAVLFVYKRPFCATLLLLQTS